MLYGDGNEAVLGKGLKTEQLKIEKPSACVVLGAYSRYDAVEWKSSFSVPQMSDTVIGGCGMGDGGCDVNKWTPLHWPTEIC